MGLESEETRSAHARAPEVLPLRPHRPRRELAFVPAGAWLVSLLLLLGGCATPPPAPQQQHLEEMLPAAHGPGAELLRAEAGSDATLRRHLEEHGSPDFLYLEDRTTLHLVHLDADKMFTFRRDAEGEDSERTSWDRIPERFFWKIPSSERKRVWAVRRASREQQTIPAPAAEPPPRRATRTRRRRPPPSRPSRTFLELRSEPSHNGALVGLLRPDDDVVVISRRGEWEWLRVPKTGVEGWVQGRNESKRPGASSEIAQYRRPENVSHYTTGSGLEVVGCRNADLLWDARAAALRGDQRTVDVQVLTDLCRRFLGGVLIEVWAENESGPRVAKVGVVLGEAGEGWEWPWFFASDDLTPVREEPEEAP